MDEQNYSSWKHFFIQRMLLFRSIRAWSMIICGVVAAAIGLKGFLLPNGFLDGGVTGIALILNKAFHWSLPMLILLINIPFALLGLNQLSKSFVIKTLVAITALAACVAFLELPTLTEDKLLISVFGGFFLGLGIGLAIRGGAVLDGTEIVAIYFSKRSVLTVGDVILYFNVIVFGVATFVFNLETAMYAMLTYLSASRTVDFVVNGLDEYTGITIISPHSEEIREHLTQKMNLGVTMYLAKRGFKNASEHRDMEVVYTVTTRLEIQKLITEIQKIDPKAFIIQNTIKDTIGGIVNKKNVHH